MTYHHAKFSIQCWSHFYESYTIMKSIQNFEKEHKKCEIHLNVISMQEKFYRSTVSKKLSQYFASSHPFFAEHKLLELQAYAMYLQKQLCLKQNLIDKKRQEVQFWKNLLKLMPETT